jgi:hypothetical protein
VILWLHCEKSLFVLASRKKIPVLRTENAAVDTRTICLPPIEFFLNYPCQKATAGKSRLQQCTKKGRTTNFFSPVSFIGVLGSWDPGCTKIRIRDPGSWINIPDPQHWLAVPDLSRTSHPCRCNSPDTETPEILARTRSTLLDHFRNEQTHFFMLSSPKHCLSLSTLYNQ